jgi:tryptophan 2,3-dioxygenase
MTTGKTPSYWDYIRVEDLLALQSGFEGDDASVGNDEALFIVVHQVYELWFKLVLRELRSLRDTFRKNPVPDVELAAAARSVRRVITIFEQAASHFRVIETLTTRDYLGFRDKLTPASGFQSAQMREIEILLGLEDASRIPLGREGSFKEALRSADGSPSPALSRVEARLADGASLKSVVYDWLARTPIDGSSDDGASERFVAAFLASHRREIEGRVARAAEQAITPADVGRLRDRYEAEIAQAEAFLRADDAPEASRPRVRRVRAAAVFLESYRELPRLAWAREIVDGLIAMEQAMVMWRQRHARMVERVIGRRVGTGGSAGVDYLDQTALKYRVFGDLWAVRTLLLQQASLPALDHAEAYRFRVED